MSSVLPALTLDRHNLAIDIAHSPKGVDSIIRQSADIILEALKAIGVQEVWQIAFLKMHTKKCNIKFQFVRQSDNPIPTIVVRTKPGGKQTCWEAALRVPTRYDIHVITEKLKRVDTRTLTLRPEHQRMTIPAPRAEEPVEKRLKICPQCETRWPREHQGKCDCGYDWNPLPHVDQEPKTPATKEALIKEALDEVEHEIQERARVLPVGTEFITTPDGIIADRTLAKQELDVLVHEPLAIRGKDHVVLPVVQHVTNPIALPQTCIDICNDQECLDRGLLAICDFIHTEQGHILRAMALHLVTTRMELDKFVDGHSVYNQVQRVAALVMKGLCDKALLSRWMHGDERTRKSTKGYILTPAGRERLQTIKGIGDKLPAAPIPQAVPTTTTMPVTAPQVKDSGLIDRVANQYNVLQPLMDELDKTEGDMRAADELLEENTKAQKTLELQYSAHNIKLDDLMLALRAAEAAIEDHGREQNRMLAEQTVLLEDHGRLVSEKQANVQKMESLKAKMREALA